jgi:hypothetical protein
LHCGSQVGLTPPPYQYKLLNKDVSKRNKYAILQRDCWSFYKQTITNLQPIDILVINGDCIDGKGLKSGGTELITSDRHQQCAMAEYCINYTRASKKIISYGTSYHVGTEEDWESDIVKSVHADKIGSHEWLDINGLVFDIKHHISSSSVPYSRHTALAKEKVWNALWAEQKDQPNADIIIRSHTHYFDYCGNAQYLAIITPALQAMGSKYGSRICSGIVDFGLIHFDVDSKGGYEWDYHIAHLVSQKAKTLKL